MSLIMTDAKKKSEGNASKASNASPKAAKDDAKASLYRTVSPHLKIHGQGGKGQMLAEKGAGKEDSQLGKGVAKRPLEGANTDVQDRHGIKLLTSGERPLGGISGERLVQVSSFEHPRPAGPVLNSRPVHVQPSSSNAAIAGPLPVGSGRPLARPSSPVISSGKPVVSHPIERPIASRPGGYELKGLPHGALGTHRPTSNVGPANYRPSGPLFKVSGRC